MPSVRRLAIDALKDILVKGGKPKETLDRLSKAVDDRRDRAFLMELVYGVVRYRDTLDWLLNKFLKDPGRAGHDTLNNLRLGVYQIFFMRVPDWASVHEAVSKEPRKKGLVNAVLRNILRARDELEGELYDMEKALAGESLGKAERVSYMSTLTSHPRWLIKRWITRFGHEEAYALAQANNQVPPLTLRVNTLRATRDDVRERLRKLGMESQPTVHSPVGLKLRGGHTFAELGDLQGQVVAQDEAAQLVAYMLEPRPGERVLDACAAPGGKTTHIAQLMGDSGEVVAVEIDTQRIRRLEENISAMGLKSIKVVQGDVTRLKGLQPFDRVVVDAPCSSLGVIRRNPDVKYRHSESALLRFKEKQAAILASASGLVRPGGVLLYCTCSTEPEEGEDVVGEFLQSSGNFFIIKDVPFEGQLVREGFLRTYPHRHGMDGFFCVRFRRRA